MQAVILAAGKSTRAYPLTLTKPKPLLKVANKPLLEHNLGNLRELADEAIIVVGYRKDLIKKHFGKRYKNLKIRYIEQERQLGTGDALLKAEKLIKNDFVSLYGDDLYSKGDFDNVIKNKYSILAKKVQNPESFGVIMQKKGILLNLIEKPQKFVSNLANAGLYKLDKKVFYYLKKLKKSERGEYEITDAIRNLAGDENISCVPSKQWLPIAYPWDLLKADRELRKNKNIVGKNSKIYGKAANSSIGDNCLIGGTVINSIIMDGTVISRGSIVEDSVIGENVYFNGKILAQNSVFSAVNGKKIKITRLGAIIGDNVKAKHVIVKAGCKIWPNKRIKNKIIIRDSV